MSFFSSTERWNYKAIQLVLLDGTDLARSIYKTTKAHELVDNILQMLNAVERDYFGLHYLENRDERVWLKLDKKIWPQIRHLDPPYKLDFGMRYYPYDLSSIEEITRYLMYLQLRKDVVDGRLVCSERERAEVLAYILQAEGAIHHESYIHKHRSFFQHLKRSSPELETYIIELYKNLAGYDSIAAESRALERSISSVIYGLEPFPVRSETQPSIKHLLMAVCPLGVSLFQEYTRIENFAWTETWNVGYSGRQIYFRILRDGSNSKQKFAFESEKHCQYFWKLFKQYFKFYIKDHSVDPKYLWGRVPPKVNRLTLFQETFSSPMRNDIANALSVSGKGL